MTSVNRAAKTCGFAAKKRECIKISKYSQERLPSGDLPAFIPLVFEHFGCWGEEATKYLRHLSKKSRDDHRKPNASEFKNLWTRLMAVIYSTMQLLSFANKQD